MVRHMDLLANSAVFAVAPQRFLRAEASCTGDDHGLFRAASRALAAGRRLLEQAKPGSSLRAGSMFMAGIAGGFCVIQFMAIQAAVHRRDAGDLRHAVHLRNLAMARLTLHSCLQMGAVIPGNSGKDGVNPNPRNRLLGLCIFSELLDGGRVLCNRDVALHTFARGWECHQFARFRICVAIFAFQAE
jgi:hypothetical protein